MPLNGECKPLFSGSWGYAGAAPTTYVIYDDAGGDSGCTAYISDTEGVEIFSFGNIDTAREHFHRIAGQEGWRKNLWEERPSIINYRVERDTLI